MNIEQILLPGSDLIWNQKSPRNTFIYGSKLHGGMACQFRWHPNDRYILGS